MLSVLHRLYFSSLILTFSGFITSTLCCFTGGQYTDDQKQWCQSDLGRCANYLCNSRTNQECDSNDIEEISDKLSCKFSGQCNRLQEDDRFPCMNNIDCPTNRKCRDGSCKLVKTGKHCVYDGQCEHYYSCEQSECVLSKIIKCGNGRSCPAGTKCKNDVCRPSRDKSACTYDSHCHPLYRCDKGQCILADTTLDGKCAGNVDCPTGYRCRKGNCKPSNMGRFCWYSRDCGDADYECNTNRECTLVRQFKKCLRDSDCSKSRACVNGKCSKLRSTLDQSGFQCSWDQQCFFGRKCVNRACILTVLLTRPPECRNSIDCDIGNTCQNGQCVKTLTYRGSRTKPECRNSMDCEIGSVCRNDTCISTTRTRPPECRNSIDCDIGNTCQNGQCVKTLTSRVSRTKPECRNSMDCEVGSVCRNDTCISTTRTRPPECRNSIDCDIGNTCQNGQCVKTLTSRGFRTKPECRNSMDCEVGSVCRNDKCISTSRVSERQCKNDMYCEVGFSCKNGICVERS